MQVICTDGTTFSCAGYELTEYGVKLLTEDRDGDDERYDDEPGAVGYVPHDRLWYIVPDGVRPNGPPSSPPSGHSVNQPPTAPPQNAPVDRTSPMGKSPEPRR